MFNRKISIIFMAAMALLALSSAAGPAFGADYSWTGAAGDGSVSNLENWSPAGVPGAGDNVLIGEGVIAEFSSGEISFNSLTCQGDLTVGNAIIRMSGVSTVETGASLTLEFGTMGGTGEIRVHGAMVWSGGTLDDAGALFIESDGDLSILGTGTKRLHTRTIVNNGVVYQENGADIEGAYGAVIENAGTFEAGGDAIFYFFTGDYPVFNNTGTFVKTAGVSETLFSGFIFENYGTVSVQAGAVAIEKGGTNTGTFQTASGAAVVFRGAPYDFYPDPRETFTGDGVVRVENGTLNLNYETASVPNLVFDFGVIKGDELSRLTVTGAMTWVGGKIDGALTTEIAAGATLTLSGTATKSLHTGLIVNNGTMVQTEGANITGAYGASIRNAGLFDAQGNGQFIFYTGDYPQFVNAGRFVRSLADTETTVSGWNFRNAGLLDVSGGVIRFGKAFIQDDGATVLKNGAQIASTQTMMIHGGEIGGSGSIDASVENGGRIIPGDRDASLSFLNITGDYTQSPTGVIDVGIYIANDGSIGKSVLNVAGQASLDGAVQVSPVDGYSPAIGDIFYFLEYGARTGDFNAIAAAGPWAAAYLADRASITRVDSPTISGIVYQEDGSTPAADVEVSAWSRNADSGGKSVTNAEGVYEISGLDPSAGDYQISAHPAGYAPAFYKDNYDGDALNDTVYNAVDAVGVGVSANRNLVLSLGNVIRGWVAYGNVPVSGAVVEAQSQDGGWGRAVTTDAATLNYEITGLTDGDYRVTVAAQGFEPDQQTLTISGSRDDVHFDLAKPVLAVSGDIVNLDSGETARVHAWSDSLDSAGTAEVSGTGAPVRYAISGLRAASDYRVTIEAANHPFQAYNGKSSLKAADLVDLSTSRDDIHFTLINPADQPEISGRIQFPAGASVGEVVFVDALSKSTGVSRSVQVTLPGDPADPVPYALTGLESLSDYIVAVSSDAYRDLYYHPAGNVSKAEDAAQVDLTDAAPDDAVDFVLDPGASISGAVRDGENVGRIGVPVHAWSENTGSFAYGVTATDGMYRLTGLEYATDVVVAAWIAERGMVYYNSAGTVRYRESAELLDTTGGPLQNIDLVAPSGKSISGTVADINVNPLAGVWVSAWNAAVKAGNGAFTGDGGGYEIKGLPEGDYAVSALPLPESQYLKGTLGGIAAGSAEVDFALGFKGYFTVSGTVTDSDGAPAADVRVEIRSPSREGGNGWVVTDALGRYAFNGLPAAADYTLTARPPETASLGFYSTRIQVSGDTEESIQLPPGDTLSGTLTETGTGDPVVGARVFAYSGTTGFFKEVKSDKTGAYRMAHAPFATDYRVAVTSPWIVEAKRAGVTPAAGVDFELEPAGVISGRVTDQDGAAVAGAIVEARSAGNAGANFAGTGIADGSGFYAIGGLRKNDAAGAVVADYAVTVKADGHPNEVRTGARPGDTVNVALTEGAGGLTGTITVNGFYLPEGTSIAVNLFEAGGGFLTFVPVVCEGNVCSFNFKGLDAGKAYQCLFESDFLAQWAGPGGDGVANDPSTFQPLGSAWTYHAGDTLDFNFASLIGRSAGTETPGTGPVRHLDSATHVLGDMTPRPRAAVAITGSDPNTVSNNPNISMTWEAADPNDANEGYYHLFNQAETYKITKRNAPHGKPATQRRATSPSIDSDDEAWYFHVAPVDDRGRIGETATAGFYVDTVAPYNLLVDAPSPVNARTVAMTLGATGAVEMYLSNFGYGEAGEWENWRQQAQWQVSEGDGEKKVYVRFRDRADNTADALAALEFRAGGYGLADVIDILKLLTGLAIDGAPPADVSGDSRTGLAEAVHALREAAGF